MRETPTLSHFNYGACFTCLTAERALLVLLTFFFLFYLKRADIAVAALTITERRDKVVDFSVPYMYYTEEMLLKKTSSIGKIDLLQFLNPFENYVWFAIVASLMVISFTLFAINYFSPYRCTDDTGKATSEEFSFFNSVWFALASLLQQGSDNTPKNLSGMNTFRDVVDMVVYRNKCS